MGRTSLISDSKYPIGTLKYFRGIFTKACLCRQGWPVELLSFAPLSSFTAGVDATQHGGYHKCDCWMIVLQGEESEESPHKI